MVVLAGVLVRLAEEGEGISHRGLRAANPSLCFPFLTPTRLLPLLHPLTDPRTPPPKQPRGKGGVVVVVVAGGRTGGNRRGTRGTERQQDHTEVRGYSFGSPKEAHHC